APLQSVGTDILVTRVVGAEPTSASKSTTSTTAPTNNQAQGGPGGGGGCFFGGGGGANRAGQGQGRNNNALNLQDTQALLNENSNVVTDLSKLGKPGDKFTHDFFLSETLLSFPQDAVSQVAKLKGVASATGGLVQAAQHETGTVPNIVAQIKTAGRRTRRPRARRR